MATTAAAANVSRLSPPIQNLHSLSRTPSPLPSSLFSKTLPKPSSLSHKKKTLFTLAAKNPIADVIGSFDDGDDDDKPREECGVVGIYGDPEASRMCYLALHALQHRGQEGAGIVAVHNNVLQSVTGVGLVSEVFNQSKLDKLPGENAIGHVRYSTAGQWRISYKFCPS